MEINNIKPLGNEELRGYGRALEAQMAKKILIKAETPLRIPYDELHSFQEDLKTLSKERYEELRRAILEDGFSFAIHVWKHKAKWHILDGHQRVYVVKKLIEEEGYTKVDLPVVPVKADSFEQAKRKLLTAASVYGKASPEGLANFLKGAGMKAEELSGLVNIWGVDTVSFIEDQMQKMSKKTADLGDVSSFGGAGADPMGPVEGLSTGPDVKMIQLFLNTQEYDELLKKAGDLQEKLKTEHLSATVLEAIRASYKANFKK